MSFCPVCKKEFPSEVTICPTCNVSLVTAAQNTTVSVFSLRQESAAEHFISYMHEQGLEGTYEYSMREDTYKIYVDKKDAMRAVKLLRLYMTEAKKKKEAAEHPASAETSAPAEAPAPAPDETPAPSSEVSPIPVPEEVPAPAPEEVSAPAPEQIPTPAPEEIPVPAPAEIPLPAPEETPAPASAPEPSPTEAPAPAPEPMPAPAELPLPVEEPVPAPVEAPTLSKEPAAAKKLSLWERLHLSKQKQGEASANDPAASEPVPAAEYIDPADPEETILPAAPVLPDSVEEPILPAESTPAETSAEETVPPSEPAPVENALEEAPEEAAEIIGELPSETDDDVTAEPVADMPEETAAETSQDVTAEPSADMPEEAAAETSQDVTAEPSADMPEETAAETSQDVTAEPSADMPEETAAETSQDVTAEPSADMPEETAAETSQDITAEPSADMPEETADKTSQDVTAEPSADADDEPSADIAEETVEEIAADDDEEEDAFSAFLSDFKRNSLSKTLEMEEREGAPIIEEIYPHSGESRAANASYEPQEPKIKVPTDTDIIEAVVDASVSASAMAAETTGSSSSFADPTLSSDEAFRGQAVRKPKTFTVSADDDLEGSFKGFVPDYAPEAEPEEPQEPTPEEEAMTAFRQKVAARKVEQNRIVAEKTKEAVRKANLVKELSNGQKIVFEDTDELDNYAGFVPDYTPNTTSEEDFSFYQPRSVSDYSKYKKKGSKAASESSAPAKLSHMRITNASEVSEVFSGSIPSGVKRTVTPQEVKTTTFLCSMTGAQLTKLFHSWLMTNVTAISVRTFETPDATAEENYEAKIEGIKKLLLDTFGELNEVFLDTVVRKYYSKYLDD